MLYERTVIPPTGLLTCQVPPLRLPLATSKVSAGFPSPAEEHVEARLDPGEYLIDQPHATFYMTVSGDSMVDVGLRPGDKVVVDRSKTPRVGDIVIAVLDGEFTIKLLGRKRNGNPRLLPANEKANYPEIEIKDGSELNIWGVVTGAFRRYR